jgi:calpain-7
LRAEVGYNPELASKHDDGIFWISWDDVLLYFQNIQLSWNPALFSFRVTTHKNWPKDQGPINDTFNVGENPQYVMVLSNEALTKKATIWVLISRHVTKQEQEGAEVSCLCWFQEGARVCLIKVYFALFNRDAYR